MRPEPFHCRKCGTCCRLAHYGEVHEEDVRSWEREGRSDVLQWVRFVPLGGNDYAYEVWIDPRTDRQAEECPWLNRGQDTNRHACRIYEVRPLICRYFPANRKHAEEVGCSGFEGSAP
jgi:Fe-S-cluster containining protein